jgi:hypothetical protein
MACFSVWDIQNCGCGPTTCNVTFFVAACTTGMPGATVNVWTNSSKTTLVATGTTDATGHVTLDVGSAGTYYEEVISPTARAVAPAAGNTTYSCGSTRNVVLTLAAGYVACFDGCYIPSPTNLHDNNGETWAWQSASACWQGNGLFNGGCQLFPNKIGNCGTVTVTFNSCSPALSVTYHISGGTTYAITE